MSEHLSQNAIEAFEALGTAARADALAHIESCAVCRERWLAQEPTRAFALLARVEIPIERLDRLSAGVSRAVDAIDTGSMQRSTSWYGAAAIAASFLLAALVGGVLWTHEMPEPLPQIGEIGFLQPLDEEVAGMHLLDSAGGNAQEVKLTIGETPVLMIFDEAIEL